MIRIREMQVKDTEEVATLEKGIFSQPWSQKGFLDAINLENTVFLVAERESHVVGYVGMYLSMDEGEITNVAVCAEERGQGIGGLLLDELLRIGEQKGITKIVLEVRVSNDSAIRLYERKGFQNVGVRKGLYEFPEEDGFIMIYGQ